MDSSSGSPLWKMDRSLGLRLLHYVDVQQYVYQVTNFCNSASAKEQNRHAVSGKRV